MSSPSSPKSLSPLRLTALTAISAVTTMKAAPGPGSASPVEVSITPIPQRSQTRRKRSERPDEGVVRAAAARAEADRREAVVRWARVLGGV